MKSLSGTSSPSAQLRRDLTALTTSYFVEADTVVVGDDLISRLDAEATQTGGDARISLHQSSDDDFHQMLILQKRGPYRRPHRHARKPEAHQIVRGSFGLLVFDDVGVVVSRDIVGTGAAFITRVGRGRWHTVLPLTRTVIYHELKPGPYSGPYEAEYPSWAPDGTDRGAAEAFNTNLYAQFGGNGQ